MALTGFAYDSTLLKEPVSIDGLEIAYPEFALFKLPGTKITIRAKSPVSITGPQDTTVNGAFVVPRKQGWYHYQLTNTVTGEILKLHVFSLVPASQLDAKGNLGHFRVGHYPKTRLKGQAIYDPPTGFIRVSEAETGIKVSPNFTVGQFLSKQSDGFPKYLVLQPELMIKLERILRALNNAGHKTDSLHIMSGYRTPFYNHAIGNVLYSRHQWGGAADIFVDQKPKNNFMDDMNRDGKIDKNDAIWLSKFIDNMSRRGDFRSVGGLGIYGSTPSHGPFVHIDVRGYRARW
ncbi:MAG: hypothetical protein KDI24_00050 [Pseudomonadales bacterium]|nr:hypothetical protein [Pseudomonadales bacterium]MCP5171464.1 hypothetical protein [Pseudomonadales bacterium]